VTIRHTRDVTIFEVVAFRNSDPDQLRCRPFKRTLSWNIVLNKSAHSAYRTLREELKAFGVTLLPIEYCQRSIIGAVAVYMAKSGSLKAYRSAREPIRLPACFTESLTDNVYCQTNVDLSDCLSDAVDDAETMDREEEIVMSCGQDESSASLLRFVDVASSRIRQALDRPRRCRRRVNHRNYLARVLAGNVHRPPRQNHESPSKSAVGPSQSDRTVSLNAGRCRKVRPTQLTAESGSHSFAVSRQHVGTDRLTTDPPVAVSPSPLTGGNTNRGPHPSSLSTTGIRGTQFVEAATVATAREPFRQQNWMTSPATPRDSWSSFLCPAAIFDPRQPSTDHFAWYQTGFHQRYHQSPPAEIRYIPYTEDCDDYSLSRHCQQLMDFSFSGSGLQQQTSPTSFCYVGDEWLKQTSLRYDQNDNEYYCSNISLRHDISPLACNSQTDSNVQDVTDLTSLQREQFNAYASLNCNASSSVSLFQTSTVDPHITDWSPAEVGKLVDTSASSFDDSGLGLTYSFGSVADVDQSCSIESSFVCPNYGYEFCSLQPACGDSI